MENASETRDQLALERTQLANERTFLAYIRTGLSLLAAAAVMFQFFASLHADTAIGWLLAAAGGLVLLIGGLRFVVVRKRLDRYR